MGQLCKFSAWSKNRKISTFFYLAHGSDPTYKATSYENLEIAIAIAHVWKKFSKIIKQEVRERRL